MFYINKKRTVFSNGSLHNGALEGTHPLRLRLASAVLAQGCARTSALKTVPRTVFFTRLTRSGFEPLPASFSVLLSKQKTNRSLGGADWGPSRFFAALFRPNGLSGTGHPSGLPCAGQIVQTKNSW
ncbi:MAG: hypothetical protein II804_08165, partial [Clostridia bacterium]|nr:hypothetical protein [Clostridia bacterium]